MNELAYTNIPRYVALSLLMGSYYYLVHFIEKGQRNKNIEGKQVQLSKLYDKWQNDIVGLKIILYDNTT